MRSFILLPAIPLLYFSFASPSQKLVAPDHRQNIDTIKIIHKLDGYTTEWPSGLFEINKETTIGYAIDNDAEFLFVTLRIPDERIQIKMMRLGMKFFIDLKGKKKEAMGIAFPIKSEQPVKNKEDQGESKQPRDDQRSYDFKTLKKMLALNLLYMNVFGFEGSKPQDQGLMIRDKANLAFAWDSANIMSIEYRIPLKLVDSFAALQQKTISIGWDINGVQMAEGTNFGASRVNQEEMEKMTKENKIWTKYTFR